MSTPHFTGLHVRSNNTELLCLATIAQAYRHFHRTTLTQACEYYLAILRARKGTFK